MKCYIRQVNAENCGSFSRSFRIASQLSDDGLLHADTFLLMGQGAWLYRQSLLCHRGLGLDGLQMHFAHLAQRHSCGFRHYRPQEVNGQTELNVLHSVVS